MNQGRRLATFWQQTGTRYGRAGRWLWLALALLAVTLLAVVIGAEKPWSGSPAERLADGRNLRARDWAVIGIWWGSLGALLATLPLLLGARWWLTQPPPTSTPRHPDPSDPSDTPPPLPRRPWWQRLPGGAWLWFGVLAAVITAGWLRTPRLDHSLWTDEEYVLRRYIHGGFQTDSDGVLAFRPATWDDALFTTKSGNNQLLHTIPARWCLDAWRLATGQPREAFSETAVRLVPWLCGLLTVAAIAWLVVVGTGGGRLGVAAAVTAAWLLALHPWHVRWGVDARGYSLMLLAIVLGWIALWHALHANRRRWWLAYAGCQAGMLLAFPGALYVALIQNTAALGLLLRRRDRLMLARLLAANLLAAIPVILLLAAAVPQILGWLEREDVERARLGWPWLRDLWSHVALGIPYINPQPDLHVGTDLSRQMAADPLVGSMVWRVLPLLGLVGCVAWLARGRGGVVIGLTMLLAPALGYLHNAGEGSPMHVWYLLFAIPLVVVAPPIALAHYLDRLPRAVPTLLLGLLLLAYAWMAVPNAWLLRHEQRQPMRQTIEWIRQQDPESPTAVFGTSDRQVLSYDPVVSVVTDPRELTEWRRQLAADGHGAGHVYACGEWPGRARRPEVLELLEQWEQTGAATEVHQQPALEALFSYRVWRVTAGDP